jgi:hypothetical protein
MALFRSHEEKVLWSLTKAIRPAGTADPAVARAVGAMGLGLAAQTGGVCVDIFGFKVRDPSDLVIRGAA